MEQRETTRKHLSNLKEVLPGLVLEDHFLLRPDLAKKYQAHQIHHYKKDIRWIIDFLSEAVWAQQPILFDEFVYWLKTFLSSLNLPMKDIAESFEILKNRLNESCSTDERALINPILDDGIRILRTSETGGSMVDQKNSLVPFAQKYLELLLKGRRSEATEMVMKEMKSGKPVAAIYKEVFQPVQYEIGRLWQTNQISVAQEHYCTASTQFIMSLLYPYLFTGEKKEVKLVSTCVSGELHEIGARMVTDFFEMEGWDTYYLGANMPIYGVIQFVREIQPQFVAISATMTFHVRLVEEFIQKIRQAEGVPDDLKILVGGYPFLVASDLWQQVGADGFAPNAQLAVQNARKLIAA
jgi:MerR family transcriptional regulator, light-induced transcriptional regulator